MEEGGEDEEGGRRHWSSSRATKMTRRPCRTRRMRRLSSPAPRMPCSKEVRPCKDPIMVKRVQMSEEREEMEEREEREVDHDQMEPVRVHRTGLLGLIFRMMSFVVNQDQNSHSTPECGSHHEELRGKQSKRSSAKSKMEEDYLRKMQIKEEKKRKKLPRQFVRVAKRNKKQRRLMYRTGMPVFKPFLKSIDENEELKVTPGLPLPGRPTLIIHDKDGRKQRRQIKLAMMRERKELREMLEKQEREEELKRQEEVRKRVRRVLHEQSFMYNPRMPRQIPGLESIPENEELKIVRRRKGPGTMTTPSTNLPPSRSQTRGNVCTRVSDAFSKGTRRLRNFFAERTRRSQNRPREIFKPATTSAPAAAVPPPKPSTNRAPSRLSNLRSSLREVFCCRGRGSRTSKRSQLSPD